MEDNVIMFNPTIPIQRLIFRYLYCKMKTKHQKDSENEIVDNNLRIPLREFCQNDEAKWQEVVDFIDYTILGIKRGQLSCLPTGDKREAMRSFFVVSRSAALNDETQMKMALLQIKTRKELLKRISISSYFHRVQLHKYTKRFINLKNILKKLFEIDESQFRSQLMVNGGTCSDYVYFENLCIKKDVNGEENPATRRFMKEAINIEPSLSAVFDDYEKDCKQNEEGFSDKDDSDDDTGDAENK